VILGSGLSFSIPTSDQSKVFPWSKIPNFPIASITGHAGELVFTSLEERNVVIQKGRIHYYEGRSMEEIVFPVRTIKLLGADKLLITNAAGAINTDFKVGDFILISDHINMIGENPLRGPNIDELGPRFPNLNDAYSSKLRTLAKDVARREGLDLKEGIYVAAPGPMYETPAEIRAYKSMGADLVGMSTVPEVIAARHCGMKILGISCVTNMAAGIHPETELSHEEVLETTKARREPFVRLIKAILKEL
jgi:purine-nucleoside phosphorylase